MKVSRDTIENVNKLKLDIVELVMGACENAMPYEKMYTATMLYPLEDQPSLDEFPMLTDAGVTKWRDVCSHDGVDRWIDIYHYVGHLYTNDVKGYEFKYTTFIEFADAILKRGTSGFYSDYRKER